MQSRTTRYCGAVDRDPPVLRIDDRHAENLAAAHRVADRDGSGSHNDRGLAALAEVREAGVADATLAIGVIHRVTAHAGRIGAFDDHVPRQVRDLAAELAAAVMIEFQRAIEFDRVRLRVELDDLSRFAAEQGVAVAAGGVVRLLLRAGDDHVVSHAPTADRFVERDQLVARLSIGTELDPRAIHRRAV